MTISIKQLQTSAIDGTTKVSDLLKKTSLLLGLLRDAEIETWVKSELNGYSDNTIPHYRFLSTTYVVTDASHSIIDKVSLQELDLDQVKLLSEIQLHFSVGWIESALQENSDDYISIELKPEGEEFFRRRLKTPAKMYLKPIFLIKRIQLEEILNVVRNEVIFILVKLESVNSPNKKVNSKENRFTETESSLLQNGKRLENLSVNLARIIEVLFGLVIIFIAYKKTPEIVDQWKNGDFEAISFIYTVLYLVGIAIIFFGIFRKQISIEWVDEYLIKAIRFVMFKISKISDDEYKNILSADSNK